ncbi:MAG: TetR/AcrR family transcriptional regulator [Spirochaetes bacterium]|nr:TetR/AcrR family transcriptional regulator [Spirochaetota bacterium]
MKSKGMLTKKIIINRIIEHVHLHGFCQTSMSDIIALTGVKKGNLYFHFKNKQKLILESLKEAHRQYQEYLSVYINKVSDPLDKIDAMLKAVSDYHTKRKFKGGCIFGNTALEMADKDMSYRKFINDVFSQWIDWVATQLKAAVGQGKLSTQTPVRELSHHIVAALEGGILLSKVTKDPEDLHCAIQGIKELIKLYRNSNTLKRRK